MRTDRRTLADRVRKVGVKIQNAATGLLGPVLTMNPDLPVHQGDADTVLDAAQALDVIAAARAKLPMRIPRADMMADPAHWVNVMNLLLDAIDRGVAPKSAPIPVTPADVRKIMAMLGQGESHGKLAALAAWLEAGGLAQNQADVEPQLGQIVNGHTFSLATPGTYHIIVDEADPDMLAAAVIERLLQNQDGLLTRLMHGLADRGRIGPRA